MNLREHLAQQQRLVDAELDRLVPPETTPPETIHRAMRYSLFAGGKRIRPILCIEASLAIAPECSGILDAACSLELFERGMGLSDACRKQLEAAETRVEMLIRNSGKLTAEPFRPEKP